MKQPNIADRLVLCQSKIVDDLAEIRRRDIKFAQPFLVAQSKTNGLTDLLTPGGDVENGGFDGFLAFTS